MTATKIEIAAPIKTTKNGKTVIQVGYNRASRQSNFCKINDAPDDAVIVCGGREFTFDAWGHEFRASSGMDIYCYVTEIAALPVTATATPVVYSACGRRDCRRHVGQFCSDCHDCE